MNNISIIIPVYNAGKYLAEALDSVLTQSAKPDDIIAVDDGSTDSSIKILETYSDRITIIRHEVNKGAGAARNTGIKNASGKWLSFLDADDLWMPHKLKDQMEFMQTHPEIDMVFGKVEQFISPELSEEHHQKLKTELKIMPGYVAGTMLISKEKFEKAGYFNENLELGEHIDWFGRAKDLGLKYHMMDRVMLRRRIHTTNSGINKKQHLKDYTSLLREALARKRKAAKGN